MLQLRPRRVGDNIQHKIRLTQTFTAMPRPTALILRSSLALAVVVKSKDTQLQNVQTSLQLSASTVKKRVSSPCLYDSIISDASARPLSL